MAVWVGQHLRATPGAIGREALRDGGMPAGRSLGGMRSRCSGLRPKAPSEGSISPITFSTTDRTNLYAVTKTASAVSWKGGCRGVRVRVLVKLTLTCLSAPPPTDHEGEGERIHDPEQRFAAYEKHKKLIIIINIFP